MKGLNLDMIKKLYHGSNHIIEHPEFGAGKRYNDYGRGFYCTEQLDMAKEWAVGVGEDGYANCYELDTEGLQILNLNGQGYTILHWLSVLLQNRQVDVPSVLAKDAKEYLIHNFNVDYMNYDVIVGYRADDSYFSFAQDFLNGTISYRQLNTAMHLGKLGQQFVLKSARSFGRLRFLDSIAVASEEWYPKKMGRDQQARDDYLNGERFRRKRGDLYITQILDEEMTSDDPRLQ